MKKIALLTKLLLVAIGFAVLTPSTAAVHASQTQEEIQAECSTSFMGLPTWFKYLTLNEDCDVVGPTEDGSTDLDWGKAASRIAIAVAETLLRIAGLVAAGFVIYGGFRFITSQGNPEGAASARTTVINALIGLVIAVSAAAIVSFIGQRLTQ